MQPGKEAIYKDSPFFGKISMKSRSWNRKVESQLLQLTVLVSLAVSKHISLTSVTTVKQSSETVPHFAALLMTLHHDVSVVRSLKWRRNLPHCTALMLSQLTYVLQFENTQGSFILELIKLKKGLNKKLKWKKKVGQRQFSFLIS